MIVLNENKGCVCSFLIKTGLLAFVISIWSVLMQNISNKSLA